jgi:U3 small nucleolar RNA-associated protein 22
VLLKVWISQRGFRTGYDSIDGHEASMIAAFLCASKRILSQMTPLMAFTAVLKFISETDFSKDTFSLNVREGGASFLASLGDTARPAAVLLLPVGVDADEACDGIVTETTVHYNILWHWSESSLSLLQDSARSSLHLIQNDSGSTENLFRDLLMQKSNFFEHYDLLFHFPVFSKRALLNWSEQNSSVSSEELRKKTQEALCDLTEWENATSSAIAVLNEALGSRVLSIRALYAPLSVKESDIKTHPLAAHSPRSIFSSIEPVWSPSETEPAESSASFDENGILCYATIGLVMNRENAHQRVTRGPFAEDTEKCERFRQFWGAKSQLRRFHDGSIVEACVWGSATQQASNQVPRGESIITEIVNYILRRHLPMYCGDEHCLDARCIRAVSNQLDFFLPASADVKSGLLITASTDVFQPNADAATLCRRAVEVVDQLRSIVASKLDGLPLGIESFVVMSPELRYTSFYPPSRHPLVVSAGGEGKDDIKANSKRRITKAVQVFPCVLNLQRSGRWPSDLVALRKIKTAMLLRIGDNLKEQFQIRSIPSQDYLDVFFHGYIFRFRLYTENEVMLLLPNIAAFRRVTGVTETEASTFSVVDLKGNKQVEITYEADQLVR